MSAGDTVPNLWYMALFMIGAFVMRGAGCTWNDIVDRDYDARVARSALRPIPAKQITVPQAIAFGFALSFIGLGVLLQFNAFTIWLAISSIVLILLYPFAKRFTYWPQFVLGLVFNWGALVGWAAVEGRLALAPMVLYAGCVLWTIGYDTIYAHQDKDDDAVLGLKSTALRFGDHTKRWLSGFYAGAIVLWALAAAMADATWVLFIGLACVAGQLAWQIKTLNVDDSENCLARFRSNRFVGWMLLSAIALDMLKHTP